MPLDFEAAPSIPASESNVDPRTPSNAGPTGAADSAPNYSIETFRPGGYSGLLSSAPPSGMTVAQNAAARRKVIILVVVAVGAYLLLRRR